MALPATAPVVVSIGGNALLPASGSQDFDAQLDIASAIAATLASVIGDARLLITHGNGPQVGHSMDRVHRAPTSYALPLHACVAQTQGEIGLVLLLALQRAVGRRALAVISLVEVDPDDVALAQPTKPVGPWLPTLPADATPEHWRHDPARGYRQLVGSPVPLSVPGIDSLAGCLDAADTVIALGGGGVPVARANGGWRGVDCVVDKDLSTSLAARALGATRLVFVTDVDAVYHDHGTATARPCTHLSDAEARAMVASGAAAAGSMGPKLTAAADFVAARSHAHAVVCAPGNLADALTGGGGTLITTSGSPP